MKVQAKHLEQEWSPGLGVVSYMSLIARDTQVLQHTVDIKDKQLESVLSYLENPRGQTQLPGLSAFTNRAVSLAPESGSYYSVVVVMYCPHFLSISGIKTMMKSNLWRKRSLYFSLCYLVHHEVEIQSRNSNRQEPESKNWSKDRGRMLLAGLLLMAYSVCFLIEDTCQKWHHPLPLDPLRPGEQSQ